MPKRSHVVLDVGANIGFFALLLQSRAPGIKVHCFEPGPITFDRLVGNIRLNGFSSNIFPYRCAVSDQNGIGYLADHSKSVERALLRTQTAVVGAEQVETITLQTA